ncbi:exopolysaccharide biosynthesis polyprenyl glycosylphosphotransferase [Mucilaginibacter myungsuensis]|uniref:Exopolysaccharide biosynthesis polyprenyl glycosylphosphotransferase n=1 Tax=Mucilaginibacter myungsuensis TaxID=649104 RepID=A0A929KSL3_9SPHI|nr:exopolysaccharide biosynthesis polyprenyl glycosylphosphotransferase [Mucilaginibacter myungsuensis]MBE9660402.1 exopolysaccharide biosynthesis polyprenyl glycosylphosphotransferase [Mucilaginibacter myungsuensis]MDN3600445.1 exopolysaccharide biosynthesis polyprenyl glycosylphosphotransferase [Mucilaginibacter myungsuensis]
MEIRYVFILIVVLIIFDITAVNLSYVLAYTNVSNVHPTRFFDTYFIILNITWIFASYFTRLYHLYTIQSLKSLIGKTFTTFVIYSLLTVVLFLIFNSRLHETLAYYIVTQLFMICCGRGIIYLLQNIHQNITHFRRNVIIVGYNDTGKNLHRYFLRNSMSFSFAGFFDDVTNYDADTDLKGDLNDIIAYTNEHNIKEIYSTHYPEQGSKFAQLFALAEYHCVKVRYVAGSSDIIDSNYCVRYIFQGTRILSKRIEPLDLLRNRILKRAFDLVFSTLVIFFVLSWLIPIISILIKAGSRGPTFFLQLRSGRDNQPFWCYKFRSMTVNKNANAQQASKGDSRVTKIGAFMRKTSIDELPQFLNVFLGHMTVVGPRPHMLSHTEQYKQTVNNYMVRHFIKPGITGWAQVNGYRGETRTEDQMHNRVDHDIWYSGNWSIYLDLKIVIATVANAVRGEENAY